MSAVEAGVIVVVEIPQFQKYLYTVSDINRVLFVSESVKRQWLC
jgi:hypothetical protein